MKKLNLLLLFMTCLSCCGWAQVDTINWKSNKLLLNKIHEGVNQYLVYTVDSATNKIGSSDIWVRTTKFEQKNSQPVFHFEWQWFHHESEYRYVAADCRKTDLAPVFQYGKTLAVITAYNFADSCMSAADSVAGNKADPMKKITLNIPVFNWEWDMELFSALPFRRVGQTFMIAFLDPSGGEPAYYEYKVISRETLKLNNVTNINCWVLKIEYEPGAYGTFGLLSKAGKCSK